MRRDSRDEASFGCGEFGHCALVSAMSLKIRTVLMGRKSKADMTCDLDLTVAPGLVTITRLFGGYRKNSPQRF